MEPINNQQINPLPPQQPAPNEAVGPKKGNGKGTILLIIVLLLIIGVALYALFAKNQLNSTQTPINNTSIVFPSPTPTPNLAEAQSPEDINVENPEADLQSLDSDVGSL